MVYVVTSAMLLLAVAIAGCDRASPPPPKITAAPPDSPPASTPSPSAPADSQVAKEAESFTDEKLLLSFPATLGELTFAGYDAFDEPGMGYSIRYNTPDHMKVDIYVYDKGLLSIPDGHTDRAISKELAGSDSTIRFYEQQGTYLDVKELGRGVYPETPDQSGVSFLSSRYQYRQAARRGVTFTGERISETFIRGFRDHFVKIRVSYPAASAERSVAAREILLKHLSQTIKTLNAGREVEH